MIVMRIRILIGTTIVGIATATYFSKFQVANDHLSGKELFIRFAVSAFCKLLSIYVFSYFPFGFEGRMWDLIVSVPDHCLSFYFPLQHFFYDISDKTFCREDVMIFGKTLSL